MRITVRAEWDMGHRLPNHGGLCKNLHGHRYVAEVALEGAVSAEAGAEDEGMVADFGPVKEAVRAEIGKLDHRFLVCDTDPWAEALAAMPGVVAVPFVPTAENLARALLRAVRLALSYFGTAAEAVSVRIYETPTAWADATLEDL